jgi:hypothetical protein
VAIVWGFAANKLLRDMFDKVLERLNKDAGKTKYSQKK